MRSVLVKKQSGEQEPFSEQKLLESLSKAGASSELSQNIISKIKESLYEGIPTRQIYREAFSLLRKMQRPLAARFSLKKAIMELGPTGFPFEQFIGEIMKRRGFTVQTGVIMQGKCVTHEVDVVAGHDHQQHVMECKFHNQQGRICNVKVPLYINSRFKDIEEIWNTTPENHKKKYQGWVITNTRFSSDAIKYGNCAGLNLVSWDYPSGGSLKDMIEQSGLFPVTAITRLNLKQKQVLLNQGIVLCRQLADNPAVLDSLGISASVKNKIIDETIDLVLPKELI